MEEKLSQLKARLARAQDLERAAAVLVWDQRTYMPPAGAEARAEQLATLQQMAHEIFVADETGALLEALRPLAESELDYDSDDASLVRVAAREHQRLRRVPPELVAERARISSLAQEAWVRARADSNFALFAPHLEKVVDLNIRLAEALGYKDQLYDPLLDIFEPQMKTAQVARLFEQLKTGLAPLVHAIAAHAGRVDNTVLKREFDADKQIAFGLTILRDIGFDFGRGRQDMSAHPFTISFSPRDVRLTTRVYRDKFQTALFGSIHEAGHGMYEQGIRDELARTPLGDGASYGVHESQSRMWENVVGRSRGFWGYYFPRLQSFFPQQLDGVDVETFYRAINQVTPSCIRVEADEVTYHMHIFVRFELEQDLLEQRLAVADLPEAWNSKMKAYLGVVPPNDAQGCLQDIHWADGTFGYFPTYSLGTLLSLQYYNQAVAAHPGIPAEIAAGRFDTLRGWLVENIHVHGKKYTPAELTRRVTGEDIQAEPFVEYVKKKYGEIYGL